MTRRSTSTLHDFRRAWTGEKGDFMGDVSTMCHKRQNHNTLALREMATPAGYFGEEYQA
jgi:hypothetical protein